MYATKMVAFTIKNKKQIFDYIPSMDPSWDMNDMNYNQSWLQINQIINIINDHDDSKRVRESYVQSMSILYSSHTK